MNHEHVRPHKILSAGLALVLLMVACSQSPGGQNESSPTDPGPAVSDTAPEQSSQTAADVVVASGDACSLLTKEQIETAFGKAVQSIGPKPPGNAIGCKVEFADGNSLNINLYERDIDKQQSATHIVAYQKGCAEGIESAFEIFNPDLPPTPSSEVGVLLSANSLGQLYLMENGFYSKCWFSVQSNASELGANVYTFESVLSLLGWRGSSEVAVVNDDRVVSFTYAEQTSDVTVQELNKATDLDSLYAIAEPYRQQVLSGYTEILLDLLKQVIGK